VRDPAVPLGETKIEEPIEKPTLNGTELAALYRKYTGRRVIVAAAAVAAEFAFVQDASPEDPLTYAQAAELLKKAASIENFVFVPDEKTPNLDILNVAARPVGTAYDVLNENDPLPEGDAVVSYVMTFKHIKPEVAAQAFTQIVGAFGTYGSIAPLNGSVVITENTSLIRRLIKLKAEIDTETEVRTRFIHVKYSDVTELAATLNDLLNAQQQAQKSAAVQRAAAPAAPTAPVTPGGAPVQNAAVVTGGASTSIDIPVQIIPEPRTNRVFAMGRPVDLLIVEGLIREFDIETSEKTFLRRKLKFVTVSDFLPIAENALNRAFTSTGEGTAGSAAGGTARGNTRPNSSTTPGGSNTRSSGTGRNSTSGSNSFAGGTSSFGNSGNSSGGGGSGSGSALGNPNANTAPESRLVGRTLLVADNITNSIVVQGPPSALEIISRLLDQIDVKADQVMISTVIGQLELTDTKSLGLEYLNLGGDVLGRAGGGLGPALLPLDKVTPLALGGLAPIGGMQVYGKIGDNFHIYMKALQATNKFTVLARPSIFTANNQKGVISTGKRVSIPTANNTYGVGTTGTVSTQYQYQDVVLKLEVIPLINSEKEITLQIALVDDEVQAVDAAAAAGTGSDNLKTPVPPTITTREILTTVTVPNNETIVLGGLIISKNTDNVSGIPLLSSIPYLGRLFSSTTKSVEKSELLVFIQPSIVTGRESLDFVQSEMDRRYKVTNNVRSYGAGTDSLPIPDKTAPSRAKNTAPPKAIPVEKSRQPQPAK
jgi:type II secretion system protein D